MAAFTASRALSPIVNTPWLRISTAGELVDVGDLGVRCGPGGRRRGLGGIDPKGLGDVVHRRVVEGVGRHHLAVAADIVAAGRLDRDRRAGGML